LFWKESIVLCTKQFKFVTHSAVSHDAYHSDAFASIETITDVRFPLTQVTIKLGTFTSKAQANHLFMCLSKIITRHMCLFKLYLRFSGSFVPRRIVITYRRFGNTYRVCRPMVKASSGTIGNLMVGTSLSRNVGTYSPLHAAEKNPRRTWISSTSRLKPETRHIYLSCHIN